MTGIAIIAPYFIKVINENLISYLFNNDVNMMPAKAPIGVKKAPIFEPIIEEYIALNRIFSLVKLQIDEYKTDIGMLLIKFAKNAEVRP